MRDAIEKLIEASNSALGAIDDYNRTNGTALCGGALFGLARETANARVALDQHVDATGALFAAIRKWATDRNLIEGATSQAQTVKLFEEGGEVAHAVARGDRDALKDGIGDMIVVLTILAAQNGLTVEECVAAAYDEIKDRKGRMVDGIFVKDAE